MNVYTFPFDTCETPQETGIAQPYSVLVNVVTCSIVAFFLVKTPHWHAFWLLLALLIFELNHTLSHFIHIPGSFLFTITHVSGFLVNLALLNFLYHVTKTLPPWYYIALWGIILAVDGYAFFNLSFIYFVLTQIVLFVAILFFYYPRLSQPVQRSFRWILGSTVVIYLGFVNEKLHCKDMLAAFPNFPFHVIIETLSIVPIYLLSSTLYNL